MKEPSQKDKNLDERILHGVDGLAPLPQCPNLTPNKSFKQKHLAGNLTDNDVDSLLRTIKGVNSDDEVDEEDIQDVLVLIAQALRDRDKLAIAAFIEDGWGKRCDTKDTDDFSELKDSDPQGRCACCEMWEVYDDYMTKKENMNKEHYREK